MTEWLWDSVMGPLITELPDTPRLALIPTGLLGVLPLHAARVADPTVPTGWRYALDGQLVTFTPNARALLEAHRTAGRVDPEADSILAVDEPLPVGAGRLPNSATEVRAAADTFPTAQLLHHQQATREAVLAALGSHRVVHFSCHGYVELSRPQDSALVMANDDPLTLWDLMGRRLVGTRLAVLSACETALPGAELLDEVISLPTGLLQAGVAGVIGSLWPVSERSTMLLLGRFYQLWRNEGVEPSEALLQAQRWIRGTTGAELAAAFPSIPALAEPRLADQRPYAHPYYWAAFTYTGT
jgi:CHAT domain-containing protein